MEDIRKGRCPLCAHQEIIEAPVVDLTPQPRGPWEADRLSAQGSVPAGFTYSAGENPQAVVVHGRLLRYACRACGYTQTFASSPSEIPIGRAYGTRLISSATTSGPFR